MPGVAGMQIGRPLEYYVNINFLRGDSVLRTQRLFLFIESVY